MTPTYFITGTDTGVGKTTFGAALVRKLVLGGTRVAVLKPAETGCQDLHRPADALALASAAGLGELGLVCPYRYHAPVAPAVAARHEGPPFDLGRVLAARDALVANIDAQLVIAEGAGGLLVPYSDTVDGAQLARALGAKLIIVARAGLGTINHTALTIEAARHRQLPIAGVVLSRTQAAADPSEPDNAAEITRLTGVPVLLTLPHSPSQSDLLSAIDPVALLS